MATTTSAYLVSVVAPLWLEVFDCLSDSITSAGGAFFDGGRFGLDVDLRFGIVCGLFFVFFVSCLVLCRVID